MMDRKARIAALAAKAGRGIAPASIPDEDKTALVADKSEVAIDGDEAVVPVNKRRRPASKEKSALEMALEEAKGDTESRPMEDAIMANVAPKKVNWDLKRDIQVKLDRLDKRTEKAIVQLLSERLQREAAEETKDDEDDEDLD